MVTRRGLLGMFAAGVGAAILPSGIIMPVRPLVLTMPSWWGPVRMYQDEARTVPAIVPGDPVAVRLDARYAYGPYQGWTSVTRAMNADSRPTLVVDAEHGPGLRFDGVA